MNNALGFPFGIFTNDNTPLDAKYFKNFNNFNTKIPYTSVAEANTILVSGLRHIGLTININGVDYWYNNGILDTDLVVKNKSQITVNTLAERDAISVKYVGLQVYVVEQEKSYTCKTISPIRWVTNADEDILFGYLEKSTQSSNISDMSQASVLQNDYTNELHNDVVYGQDLLIKINNDYFGAASTTTSNVLVYRRPNKNTVNLSTIEIQGTFTIPLSAKPISKYNQYILTSDFDIFEVTPTGLVLKTNVPNASKIIVDNIFLYVIIPTANQVLRINTTTFVTTHTFATGGNPIDLLITKFNGFLFILNESTQNLTIVDLSTFTSILSDSLGFIPTKLITTRDSNNNILNTVLVFSLISDEFKRVSLLGTVNSSIVLTGLGIDVVSTDGILVSYTNSKVYATNNGRTAIYLLSDSIYEGITIIKNDQFSLASIIIDGYEVVRLYQSGSALNYFITPHPLSDLIPYKGSADSITEDENNFAPFNDDTQVFPSYDVGIYGIQLFYPKSKFTNNFETSALGFPIISSSDPARYLDKRHLATLEDLESSGGGSGITSINNLTGGTQTLVTGNTGTDFNISSVGNTHSFNLPFASGTTSGRLSSSDWNTFNNKLDTNIYSSYTGGTNTLIGTKLNISDFNVYSGSTDTRITNNSNNIVIKLDTSNFNAYSSSTLTNINTRLLKSDFDTYSGNTNTRINTIESNYVSGGTNLGGGLNLFSSKNGGNLNFNTLSGGTNVTLNQVGNKIVINSAGVNSIPLSGTEVGKPVTGNIFINDGVVFGTEKSKVVFYNESIFISTLLDNLIPYGNIQNIITNSDNETQVANLITTSDIDSTFQFYQIFGSLTSAITGINGKIEISVTDKNIFLFNNIKQLLSIQENSVDVLSNLPLRFVRQLNSKFTSLKVGLNTVDVNLTLPITAGTNGQALFVNGSGQLYFGDVSSGGIIRVLNQSGNTLAGSIANSTYHYQFTASGQLTLPTAVSNNCMYIVKNSSMVNITVVFTSGQNADGDTTITMTPKQSITFISDNNNYTIN